MNKQTKYSPRDLRTDADYIVFDKNFVGSAILEYTLRRFRRSLTPTTNMGNGEMSAIAKSSKTGMQPAAAWEPTAASTKRIAAAMPV